METFCSGIWNDLRVVSSLSPEDRRESQDGGGRARKNWGEDKKARRGRGEGERKEETPVPEKLS